MFRPVKFCFAHERIRVRDDLYLKLEAGILNKLSSARIHCQHEPCDQCPRPEKPEVTQPSLFGKGE